ncbi:MAG: hypothetical protein AAF699_03025 [Pseudomonadota bacterium]
MDVSNTVDVSDADAVRVAVLEILQTRYPGYDFASIDVLVSDFSRLYSGHFPGFEACDAPYHNAQHVLDVTLAMARLIAGYECEPEEAGPLGPDFALAGIATALFHDSGYLRRTGDTRNHHGAAYTRVHVKRGARLLREYLPQAGLPNLIGVCTRIIHFTTYRTDPRSLTVENDRERCLGSLLGTADLIAQMADVDYLHKCREHLYREFEIAGLAGERAADAPEDLVFRSPDHLLETTPAFMRKTIDMRLEQQLGGMHRYAARFFGGTNLYMDAITENWYRLQDLLTVDTPALKTASVG